MLMGFQLPVGPVDISLRGQNGIVPGQKGVDLPEYTGRRRSGRSEQQYRTQSVRIHNWLDCGMAQHRADRRAKHQPVVSVGGEQRLDAQPVAAQRQPPLFLLPDRKGENAVKT